MIGDDNQMRFKVCVRCLTFNHSKYILDSLHGFEIQETGFPFVAVVIDDASTDGEQDVIRDCFCSAFEPVGPQSDTFLFGRNLANPDYYLAAYLLDVNHYSRGISKLPYFDEFVRRSDYIAMCEGDDFWTDPSKLKMQVSFMDAHQDYVLCHTDFESFPIGRMSKSVPTRPDDDYLKVFLDGEYYIGTLTALYRSDAFQARPFLNRGKGFAMGDLPLWIELMRMGKVKYLPVKTACYRILDESAAHSKDIEKELEFLRSGIDCLQFYADEYGIAIKDQNPRYFGNALRVASSHRDKKVARRLWKEARQKNAVTTKSRIYYFATMFPLLADLMGAVRRAKTNISHR